MLFGFCFELVCTLQEGAAVDHDPQQRLYLSHWKGSFTNLPNNLLKRGQLNNMNEGHFDAMQLLSFYISFIDLPKSGINKHEDGYLFEIWY